ncbi:hypothetical protein [Glutamicibacter sp.]|uniref:hypothetical protein n=1 Tax=Glutamicibacter sp. TaxID=1931995 RepID=UPI002B476485|nr:hypothetical protein [Glutamicibacter sp.]HJX79891.1 hypothetical protein [Glutamicibacter sp.]
MSEARIVKLEEEISNLRELLTSMTLSVEYRKDMAVEASLSNHQIAGQTRTALTLVLGSIQSRAEGEEPQQVRNPGILERFPVIAEAQIAGSIDLAEAIRLVARIVGNHEQAYQLLRAHHDSGFGVEAYKKLGLGLE